LKANKLEALGVLAGGIAHDFNNILTAILGGLSLAQMMAPPDNPIQEHLRLTERACDQARALANQLLTFSAGGAPLKSLVSIADLLRDSATFALHGSNVRCELDIPDDLWSIEADEGQIGQVIHNLVLNADQAMPEGGVLTVRAENLMLSEPQDLPLLPDAYVKIIIADRGVGIPADYLPRVFDPFFTTKARGKGLGLAIVYSVIRRHNGYVTVQSEPGVGTTFTIYLPASFKSAAPPQKPTEGTPQGEGRILLMEDEPLIRNITGELLKNLNYQVEFARDGSEAITLYEQALGNGQPFDAVILDLTVPGGMGGKEAIQKLRRIDPDVRAIVASGYSDDPVVAYYQDYGFVRAISKPYRLNDLSRILNEVLGIGR
jgi:CheY-like chemotaxis protein